MSVPKNPSLQGEEEDEGVESYGTAESMDPELYRATSEGDILEFVRAMEREPVDSYRAPPAGCIQLGPQKNTVLHIATSFKHYEIVKLICKDLPFFVAEKNAKGDTALHIAARAGDALLVRLLLDSDYKDGGYLGEKNGEGNTALHEALHFHHEKVARILIDRNRNMSYSVNKEGKSLLYLAAEAGFVDIVRLLMGNPVGIYGAERKIKIKSALLAAILGRNIGVLMILWEKDQSSFYIRCERRRNPLHYAACIGYHEGVNFLLNKYCAFTYQRDNRGFFPIHIASRKGHIGIVQSILKHCPDSRDLLTLQGYNILHETAKSGKTEMFTCMLKMAELEQLVNEKDDDGNTPLHVATFYGHPKIVSTLTEDERVRLETTNNVGLTALDIAEDCMETMASFRKVKFSDEFIQLHVIHKQICNGHQIVYSICTMQRLTWMALRVAGAPRAKVLKRKSYKCGEQPKVENYRDKVHIVLLVATLVATVTFTAGFTIPGGYNNSEPDQGTATMLKEVMFQEFVICDTISMYCSILVTVTLIWAQLGDINSLHVALKFCLPILGIALVMMSVAFMAGVYLVVSKLGWLAHVVLFLGLNFTIVLLGVYLPLCFLGSSKYYIFRKFSYYPFRLMLYAFGSYDAEDAGV